MALSAALGCGLLVGIERERRKGTGAGRALAGVRTFALVCVLGAAAPLTGLDALVALGGLAVAALGVVAYLRSPSDDPGVTTEVALFLTYVIGVLCTRHIALAAALAVGLTVLLAARERMHHIVTQWLRPHEVRDGLLLVALALIVLPLVPDRPLWGPVLNPRVVLQLLVLLLALQAAAHLARRLLAARHAVALSALASGFVSSTATVAAQGLAVRNGRLTPRAGAGAALLSCVATLVQLPLIALAVQPGWLATVWMPALAGAALALVWGAWLLRAMPAVADGESDTADGPVFSLRQALLMALLLAGLQALIHALGIWLGEQGARTAAVLAALFELHATASALMVSQPPPVGTGAVVTLAVMLGGHALSKTVNAALSGGARYALWLAPGLWLHTALCVAALVLVRQ